MTMLQLKRDLDHLPMVASSSFLIQARSLGGGRSDATVGVRAQVVWQGEVGSALSLAEEFSAKHDLTVFGVEVCDLCLDLVSWWSALCR